MQIRWVAGGIGALFLALIVFGFMTLFVRMWSAPATVVRENVDHWGLDLTGGDAAQAPPEPGKPADGPSVGRTYCDVSHSEETPADCEFLTSTARDLQNGTAAVEHPGEMAREEAATVSLVISRTGNRAASADMLGAEPTAVHQVSVGRRMAARLHGEGFRVEPAGLQHRDLVIGQGARWDWEVTALKAPRHRLMLSAYVVVQVPGEPPRESFLRSFNVPLRVQVTWGQRVGDLMDDTTGWMTRGTNWIVALTALITAVLGLLALFKRKKQKHTEEQAVQ